MLLTSLTHVVDFSTNDTYVFSNHNSQGESVENADLYYLYADLLYVK